MNTYTGKTVDEVLKNITEKYDCKIEDVKYKVVEETKHLFGIGNSVTVEAYTPQDVKDFIFDYLGAYFSELNQGVSIEIITKDNVYKVILEGENNAILIGKNGQTLKAVSTVLRSAVHNTFKERIEVLVDVGHYREERYRKVKRIAAKVAKEVQKSHVAASLDPMSNDERKVIHEYLKGFTNIKTESEDEGAKRHIVIRYTED